MSKGCVIVTGASRGIGAAIAVQLARAGWTVGCLSRSGSLPRWDGGGAGEIDDATRARLIAVKADIVERDAVEAAFAEVARRAEQPIVALVNNAGVHSDGPSDSLPLDAFEEVMTMNATSVLGTSQVAYPYLRSHGGGVIVNIGSFYDKLGVKRNVAYCASKAAVGAITRCLAVEWARDGIRVLNVAPGYVATDLNREQIGAEPLSGFLRKRIPLGGPGSAEDIANLVVQLVALPGGFMTGETLYIDGGQGMAL